jgi:hypothetical protein
MVRPRRNSSTTPMTLRQAQLGRQCRWCRRSGGHLNISFAVFSLPPFFANRALHSRIQSSGAGDPILRWKVSVYQTLLMGAKVWLETLCGSSISPQFSGYLIFVTAVLLTCFCWHISRLHAKGCRPALIGSCFVTIRTPRSRSGSISGIGWRERSGDKRSDIRASFFLCEQLRTDGRQHRTFEPCRWQACWVGHLPGDPSSEPRGRLLVPVTAHDGSTRCVA